MRRPTALWEGYLRYCESVARAAPEGLSLRDKDRYLWGRSAAKQLKADIQAGFPKKEEPTKLPASTVPSLQEDV